MIRSPERRLQLEVHCTIDPCHHLQVIASDASRNGESIVEGIAQEGAFSQRSKTDLKPYETKSDYKVMTTMIIEHSNRHDRLY
jgi:hypothetical protein